MSGNNYSYVTSARHRVGDGGVDGAQVRRRAFAGTMTNGRRRVGFPVCVLERKLVRFFLYGKQHSCGKQKVGYCLKVTNRNDQNYKLSIIQYVEKSFIKINKINQLRNNIKPAFPTRCYENIIVYYVLYK